MSQDNSLIVQLILAIILCTLHTLQIKMARNKEKWDKSQNTELRRLNSMTYSNLMQQLTDIASQTSRSGSNPLSITPCVSESDGGTNVGENKV